MNILLVLLNLVLTLIAMLTIRNIFDVLGKDLDLADLNMEYPDLIDHNTRLEEKSILN